VPLATAPTKAATGCGNGNSRKRRDCLSRADDRGQRELERENGVGSGVLEKRRKCQRRMRQRSGWFGWNAWPAGEITSDGVRDERLERKKGNGRQLSHRLRSKVHLDQG